MSVIRLIHIKIDPAESENAVRVWKAECAPLMIQQNGCMSEKLLRCKDAPEFISYSEWGIRGRDRGLSQERGAQGDRAPRARAQRRQGRRQTLRRRAVAVVFVMPGPDTQVGVYLDLRAGHPAAYQAVHDPGALATRRF